MKKQSLPILTLITLLMAANLACNLSAAALPSPTPTRFVPVSTQAAGSFVQSVEQPTVDPATGTITIQLTEEQITSYVAYQLQQDPNPILRNPQIFLNDGQFVIQGQITSDVMTADGTLTAKINIDEAGTPQIEILTAQFGSVPIPTAMLSSISSVMDHYLTNYIDQYAADYQIQSITIGSHVMTIVIKKK